MLWLAVVTICLSRVNAQFRKFAELSERNAKHLYIERCLEMPGYGSTFHDVKVFRIHKICTYYCLVCAGVDFWKI